MPPHRYLPRYVITTAGHYQRQVGYCMSLGVVPGFENDVQVGGKSEHERTEKRFFPSGAHCEHQCEKSCEEYESVVGRPRKEAYGRVEVFYQVEIEIGCYLVSRHAGEHTIGQYGSAPWFRRGIAVFPGPNLRIVLCRPVPILYRESTGLKYAERYQREQSQA